MEEDNDPFGYGTTYAYVAIYYRANKQTMDARWLSLSCVINQKSLSFLFIHVTYEIKVQLS